MAPNCRKSDGNPVVYLDVTIDGEQTGRITLELFADAVPKAQFGFCVVGWLHFHDSALMNRPDEYFGIADGRKFSAAVHR